MTEHTNRQFSADLEAVRSQFLEMGGVVETMIQDAVEALHECVVLGAWDEAKGGRGEGGCHGVAPI
mgnify:CR=1 FL=1